MKWIWLTPVMALMASNPVEAVLFCAGYVALALILEWALGWNRR